MKATITPVAEITATAITILCREIGAANTARFLGQFSTGFGDYTAERDQIIGNPTVAEIVAEIKQRRKRKAQPTKPARRAKSKKQ